MRVFLVTQILGLSRYGVVNIQSPKGTLMSVVICPGRLPNVCPTSKSSWNVCHLVNLLYVACALGILKDAKLLRRRFVNRCVDVWISRYLFRAGRVHLGISLRLSITEILCMPWYFTMMSMSWSCLFQERSCTSSGKRRIHKQHEVLHEQRMLERT